MNKNILILTDSSTTMSQDDARKYGVKIIPLSMVRNDNKEYVDEILDITPSQMAEMLDNGYKFKTSCTPIGHMQSTITEALKTYDAVIAIPISSGWSSQYSHLKSLEQEFSDKLVVCDTREYGYSLEILAIKIRELIDNGQTELKVLQAFAESFNKKTSSFVSFKKLDGAVASGRVPKILSKILKWVKAYPVIRFEYVNHLEKILRKWEEVPQKCISSFKNLYDQFNHEMIDAFAVLTTQNDPKEIEYVINEVHRILKIPVDKIAIRATPIILHTVVWNDAIGFQLVAKINKKA